MEIRENWKGVMGIVGKDGVWKPLTLSLLAVEKRILIKRLTIIEGLIKEKS